MSQASIFVKQEADENHPDEVQIDPFEEQFASVFKTVAPDVTCPHCVAHYRVMFMAGLAALDDAYVKLGLIKDKESTEKAADWVQGQVDAASDEVHSELRINNAINNHNIHCEPEGKH